jgi:predicted nucleic acid-binding protein
VAATTLVDTGPLVALVDRNQSAHGKCLAAHESIPAPLVTTWPCLTEAMYFLEGIGGWRSQKILWEFIERHGVELHTPNAAEADRIRALMEKYSDTPMDLADASLVASAETRQLRRVFTLDSDFRVYRANDKETFEMVP